MRLSEALKYGTLRIPSRKVGAFIEGGNNEHRTYFANEVAKHPYAAEQVTDKEGNTHSVVGERKSASDSQDTNFVFAPLSNGHFLVHRDLGGEGGHVDSAILSPEAMRQWHSELDQFDGTNAASKNRHRFNQALRDHLQTLLLPPTDFDAGDKVPLFQNKWDSLPEAEVGTADRLPHELPKSLRHLLTDDSTPMERKGTAPFAGDDTLPHERPPEQWGIKADDRLPWEYRNLKKALRYATKRASAADYHKAFDRLAADPKAEETAKGEALLPTEFFAEHLRSEGHHPQADLIEQAMSHSKAQGEPVVYSEQIDKFPPHHRETLEGLGQGDFPLVLGKPNSDYTNAVLYQRSHTDPSKVFGWTDSIEGSPDEVKAEVERFQRAGVPVELAIKPDNPQYQRWAKHFGLSGYSEEEPEQYAKKKAKTRSLQEVYNDFIADTDTEGWSDDEKRLLEAANKHEKQKIAGAGINSKEHHQALAELFSFHHRKGRVNLAKEIEERMGFLKVPLLGTVGEIVPYDWDMESTSHVPEGTPVRVLRRGVGDLTHPQMPFLRTLVTPEVDKEVDPVQADAGMGNLAGRYESLKRALKYINETHADFHNRILENPEETTPALVYADWLEENGKPAHADLIRRHIKNFGETFVTDNENHSNNPFVISKDDSHNWVRGTSVLRMRTPDGKRELVFQSGSLPKEEQLALHSDIVKEGAKHWDNNKGTQVRDEADPLGLNPTFGEPADPVSEHFSASDKPLRYSAVPEHEVHEDYAPNGIAPRIGHTLKQLALEDSTTGALAEGILRTGDHSILPILADRLEETDHPMASAFDWRHAPRAIRIDRALHRQISQRQVRHPDGHRVPLTAGWVIADMQDGVQRPAFSRRKALLAARLAVPDATTEDLLHSLFRLMDHREVADTAPELVEPVAAHTKALTAARLQQLRQRQGDPYHYEDTRQQNKRLYGSWRAPAGGMVVQQSPLAVSGQWAEGGEFVNDLSKLPSQSVEYKKRPKKRLTVEYIRQHFRKAKRKNSGVTVVTGGSDSEGGDSGEGE